MPVSTKSMSSRAASRAKTSASTEGAQASQEAEAASGLTSAESLASYDPASRSWKTSTSSPDAASTEFSGTWPRYGMTRSGRAFRLPKLALIMSGPASGSSRGPKIPTIRASEWKGCGPLGSKSHTHWLTHYYLSAIVTDSGKLSPTFAERMQGFPEGWTEGSSRAQRLKQVGNSIVPQIAEFIGLSILALRRR